MPLIIAGSRREQTKRGGGLVSLMPSEQGRRQLVRTGQGERQAEDELMRQALELDGSAPSQFQREALVSQLVLPASGHPMLEFEVESEIALYDRSGDLILACAIPLEADLDVWDGHSCPAPDGEKSHGVTAACLLTKFIELHLRVDSK